MNALSAPLLRELLPAADVTRLRTLRPAWPAPGLYAVLRRRVPWPDGSRVLPCNALPAIPAASAGTGAHGTGVQLVVPAGPGTGTCPATATGAAPAACQSSRPDGATRTPSGGMPAAPFAALPDLPAGALPGLRLAYLLFALPWPDAVSLLRACALATRQLWLADFILAERNLGLPAALLRRALPGFLPWGRETSARVWLRRGGLEGCLHDAGCAAAQRRTLLAGAAALIRVAPKR
ncbi:hypothetical protein [uncultured Desulfovibrio sp.]|uniref:hypothetical protein n=1 Tax=uncultured Desulfovibrio sp. TaxID=167968 RepID=UPI0026195664|nr:hypothetical protein [uncultured Desulfovibrio sp.]